MADKLNILVTGSVGNVGSQVIKTLLTKDVTIYAADLNKDAIKTIFGSEVKFRKLNFYDKSTFESSLKGIDSVFLMRPPQIGKVKKYMFPFIDSMKKNDIKHVVTLSISDASPFVPHYKLESYIEKLDIPYTHVRAGYFMQNLTTTHREVIKDEKDLFIPAGDAKFSFTHTKDIGEVSATILATGKFKYQTLNITGSEALDLYTVAERMSNILKQSYTYSNPSSKAFKKMMKKYNFHKDMIRVMGFIYLGARKKGEDKVYPDFEKIMKKKPIKIDSFIKEYASSWI